MSKTVKHILVLTLIVLIGTTATAQKTDLNGDQKAQMEAQLMEYYEKLDLSEEQKPKFEEISIKYGQQMRGLKDSNKGRLAKYKEFKSIRKNKDSEMKAILSKEQYDIYLETQEEMQQKMKENNKNKS